MPHDHEIDQEVMTAILGALRVLEHYSLATVEQMTEYLCGLGLYERERDEILRMHAERVAAHATT